MQGEKDIQFGALKIFTAVAEADTLTDAARKLGITQSAVSQAIAQLERTTSTQLVVRRSRPIKLTPGGQVLREHAEQILAGTRRMLAAVQTAAAGGLKRLRIGCIDSFGDAAALHLIDRVETLAVQLSLQTGFTAPLSQAFLQRDLDVLITSDPLEDHPELDRHPILRDPFLILAPAELCGDADPDAAQLARSLPFVRYTRRSRLGALGELITRRLGIEPRTRYELDSTQTLLRCVKSGQAWAITTALCIARYPALLEGVRIVALANSANARYLSVLARRDELGAVPETVAGICREIFDLELRPRIAGLAPFLGGQARAIDELPVI